MNLYILHYHLQPGGVTKIISLQVESLKLFKLFDKIKIICGFAPKELNINHAEIIQEKSFNYTTPGKEAKDYIKLKDDIYSAISRRITKEDIIHVHNPNLGKNPAYTQALFSLAKNGYKIFYHCHDFAEDRKKNYNFLKQVIESIFSMNLQEVIFPKFNNCVFGVLNSFDLARLKSSGIKENRIKYLPNPVAFTLATPKQKKETIKVEARELLSINNKLPIILYPVRVICRKNIGELILLASIFRDRANWCVTMAPHNPVEKKFYQIWKDLNMELNYPLLLEVGKKIDLEKLMQATERVITTSVKEGFGMSFIEPWLFNVPVIGRNIPYIIKDFQNAGMVFTHLYNSLPVVLNGEKKDFKDLSIDDQIRFIRLVSSNQKIKNEFIKKTDIEHILFSPILESEIINNKQIVEESYSLENYGRRLCTIYKELS